MNLTERARKRIRMLDRYVELQQAKVSFYARQSTGMSQVEVLAELGDLESYVHLMAIQQAVAVDLLEFAPQYERCLQALNERTVKVVELLQAQDAEEAKKKKAPIASAI